VEITIPNPREELRPGMFCRATFYAGQVEAMIVPGNAVLKVQGSNERYVFVEKNGKAVRHIVEIGRRFDDQVEIMTNGVKPGDRLIVSGQARLVDGVNVMIVE
jgi:multidrug efflux pump subunit AcrA (membrane-fusion protein)